MEKKLIKKKAEKVKKLSRTTTHSSILLSIIESELNDGEVLGISGLTRRAILNDKGSVLSYNTVDKLLNIWYELYIQNKLILSPGIYLFKDADTGKIFAGRTIKNI